MADALQEIGVRAVADGISQYVSALNTFNSKTADAAKKTQDAAKATGGLDKATSAATGSLKGASGAATDAAGALGEMGGAADIAAAATGGLSVVIGIAVAAVTAFIALAQRGAGFSELENGFSSLTAAVNEDANLLLGKMRDATGGTISDMELLTEVNRTLIGVSKEFGHQFGEALPDLMKIAKAVAEATGRDTMQVFDAITESIKRGDTRMLKSLGIIIDQKKAYEQYAASIHKTVAELTLADREQAVLNAVQAQGKQITDALGNSVESNADKQVRATTTVTNILDKLSSAVQPLFGLILDSINGMLDAFSAAFTPAIAYIGGFVSLVADGLRAILQPVFDFIGKITGTPAILSSVARNLFVAGARMIGELAKGILQAANQYVFPAILAIAQGIADFLIGLSPPPKGPLSLIDQGGANVMQSWISGFTGVSLDPVEDVAKQVSNAMGTVATEGIDAVKTRLAQLDTAIAPFQNRLKIVQSTFDALKPAQEAAFRAIDRQLASAQKALAGGDQSAAALVQHLDEQRAQLQAYVDTQQEAVDNAQIQLSFAEAQQAQERAILGIREKQIGTVPKAAPAAAKGGKGGGGAAEAGEPLGAGFGAGKPFDIAGDIGKAKEDISAGLAEGFAGAAPELATAQSNIGKIGLALNQIGSVDIGSKLKEKFASIFDPAQDGSVLNNITKWFALTFSPDSPQGIVATIKKLPDDAKNALTDLGSKILGVLNPIATDIAKWIDGVINPAVEGSVPKKITEFVTKGIPDAFAGVEKFLTDNFYTPLNTVLTNITTLISDILFSDKENIGVNWYIRQMLGFFAGIPQKIADGMTDLGKKLTSALLTPVANAGNSLLKAIHDVIKNVIDGIKDFILSIANHFAGAPGVDDLIKSIQGITVADFGTITVPAAAEGGLFGRGALSINPREELFGAADKMAVFPHEFVTSVRALTQVMAQIAPSMQAAISHNTTNIDRSMTANFSGTSDSGEVVRRLAVMRAYT